MYRLRVEKTAWGDIVSRREEAFTGPRRRPLAAGLGVECANHYSEGEKGDAEWIGNAQGLGWNQNLA